VGEQIMRLKGRTLETLGRARPFLIEEVTEHGIEVVVCSTGSVRYIPRTNVETGWVELCERGELTLDDIRKRQTEANPAYGGALLAELPGIVVEADPIRLRRDRDKVHGR